MKRTPQLVLALVLVLSSFITGFAYRDFSSGGNRHNAVAALGVLPARLASAITATIGKDNAELTPVETYASVYSYLDSNYYGKHPENKQLTYQAVRGMMSALGDRYTRFLDPEEYKQMQQDNRGDFEGIGAELDVKDGRVIIKKPIKNSPAIHAGLKSNDMILKVDDHLVQGLDITEVVKKIRGPRGTKVKLTIKREGAAKLIEVQITRDIIPFTIVEWEMKDESSKIGYIALRQFNEKSDEQCDEALTELDSKGMRGLVLDLRGNPGGLLDVAVDIGSRFIDKGDIVIIKDKGDQRTALQVEQNKHDHPAHPLVVLIDHGSASASEIVSGAIQDHKAGTLIGTESFGKGLVQTIINIPESGAAVAITTAKYLTPDGHDVTPTHKIQPEIKIEPTDEDLKKENDVQLKKAIQVLKEKLGDSTQTNTAKKVPEKG